MARRRMIKGDDMTRSRTSFCLAAALATATLSGPAIAQTPASPAATKPAASMQAPKPSITAKVETWTRAQWEAAKKEWVKDSTKWANCQKQWNRYKHEDRKRWPSIYKCMTS
jgi:hypothetical protein